MGAVYYNIMLDAEDLQFIEKCINKHNMTPVYYDPFHLQIVRDYMQLLGVSRCDTLTLTDTKRIEAKMVQKKTLWEKFPEAFLSICVPNGEQ